MKTFLKTITAAALISGLSLISSAYADGHKIKIGTEGAYPPFNFMTSDGKLDGFDVDITKALCEEMKAECEFVTQDWDGIIPGLLAKKYDAIIASMSITEERKQKVDFTNKYYNTPPALAVAKDSKLTADSDMKGAKIGAQSGTTHSNYAEEKLSGSELKVYPTPAEYKADLSNGRLDAVIDDVVVLDEWIKSDEGSCCKILKVLKPDLKINGEGAGIAIRKGEDELREKFNKAIEAIRANGKYEEINKKYFDFDVYGD